MTTLPLSHLVKTKSRIECGLLEIGAGNETRTRDPNLGKVVLYQLSYSRLLFEPRILCGCSWGVNNRQEKNLEIFTALISGCVFATQIAGVPYGFKLDGQTSSPKFTQRSDLQMDKIDFRQSGNGMKVLMCEPEYYDVCYEINPWMHVLRGVEVELARRQWQNLRDTIQDCGAEVVTIEQVATLPDMVFTANAGLVRGNQVWLSHFRFPERQKEYGHFRAWFEKAGFEIRGERPEDFSDRVAGRYRGPEFEGAGDALFLGDILFGGYGFRSDAAYYERIASAGFEDIVLCRLVDPRFYHLDTCFCPLNARQALWWPQAFSDDSRWRMEQAAELIPVPEAEAQRFACNAVVLGGRVVVPSGCPETRGVLEGLGFAVHECGMSEFIKAGGACKCLTLRLDR